MFKLTRLQSGFSIRLNTFCETDSPAVLPQENPERIELLIPIPRFKGFCEMAQTASLDVVFRRQCDWINVVMWQWSDVQADPVSVWGPYLSHQLL